MRRYYMVHLLAIPAKLGLPRLGAGVEHRHQLPIAQCDLVSCPGVGTQAQLHSLVLAVLMRISPWVCGCAPIVNPSILRFACHLTFFLL